MVRLACVRNTELLLLIVSRRKDALIVVGLCNMVGADAGRPHFKDSADICRCFGINHGKAFGIRSLDISVRRIGASVNSFLGVGFNDRADFLARVGGVPLVKDVHDRRHIHPRVFRNSRIHIVTDGNEADIVGREQIIRVLPHLNIVSAEAAEVFDDDRIDPAVLGILQQSLYTGAVEVGSAPAVVDILVDDLKSVLAGIFLKNLFLILNGQGFSRPFVLLGQPVVKSCFSVLYLL